MDILVFSDSHDHIDFMETMIQRHTPALILHLGDCDRDAKTLKKRHPDIPIHMVRGNCDILSRTTELEELTIAGKKVVLTHGHRYNVKYSYNALYTMGQCAQADIVCFGHTHIPHYEVMGKMHVINPGSARECCALLTIDGDTISCRHLTL